MARRNFTDRELGTMLSMLPPATIPKSRAMLCLDCDNIFAMEGAQKCPACGSGIGVAVSKILDRGETK